jgi:hypothetical protein
MSDAKILILATIIVTIFYVQSMAPVTILLIVVVAPISIAITMGMWKELIKYLADVTTNVWSEDLTRRDKSDDFNSFLMHLFF